MRASVVILSVSVTACGECVDTSHEKTFQSGAGEYLHCTTAISDTPGIQSYFVE